MVRLRFLLDRTAVLFLGVAAGAAIGFAFASGGDAPKVATTLATVAPPPPATTKPPAETEIALECAMPFQQQLLDTVTKGEKVRIGVFGDSFGDGVWSALYRQLPASKNYQVIKYSQQSTGFTRYASLNLEDHAREQLSADPIDIAVISFGANDTQGVWAAGHAAALLSPEWQKLIGERIENYVAVLRSKGAMVYWVGLPKMRKESFDADISGMNDFYEKKMKALGVPFIATAPLSVDAAGQYAAYLPDGPKQERTLIRANDGIHMSMTGYVRITRPLAKRIDAYVAAARQRAGVTDQPATPKPPAKQIASAS